MEFTPDGKRLAAAASGSELSVWQVKGLTGRVSHAIPERTIISLAFLRDGEDIAFVTYEGGLNLLSSTGWNEIARSDDRCDSSVAASPDSQFIATCSANSDHDILILNLDSLRLAKRLQGHRDVVVCVRFSPSQSILASGGFDDVAKVWDFQSGECLATLSHDVWVESLAFSPDGKYLAAAGSLSGVIKVWDMRTYDRVAEFDVHGGVNSIAYSMCGNYLFVAQVSDSGYVSVFKTDGTGDNVTIECDAESSIYALAVSPDGELLATGTSASRNGNVRLWRMDELVSLFNNSRETDWIKGVSP